MIDGQKWKTKPNLALLINKQKLHVIHGKLLKGIDFCHLQEIYTKTVSKKVVQKTADKIVKPKPLPIQTQEMMKKQLFHQRQNKKYKMD